MWNKILCASGVVAAALFFADSPTHAVPVPFSITGASFTPDIGYGIDANESSGTLLDVRFSTSGFVAQSFSLNLPSPASQTFLFGTVDLEELNAMSGIVAAETDNLAVTANFLFVDPLGGTQTVTATGTAVIGSVSDVFVDYTLTWTPVTVNFGVGGQFMIDLAPLTFSGQGLQNLDTTVTLLALPRVAQVPEPASLLLLGLGLTVLAIRGMRKVDAACS